MISYLIGKLIEKNEGFAVIETSGIGYYVLISNNCLSTLPEVGEEVKLNTFMQVKEDGISLFGFINMEEKELFLKLISVSGVGPKMALCVLSGYSYTDLIVAIVKEDITLLSKIKGLGKKTAERIVLELKDKISVFPNPETLISFENINEDAVSDATETLISLGINKNEAYRLARAAAKENSTPEDIISIVLRGMVR